MRPGETPDKRELLELIDVLVDGRFIRTLKDSLLQFRGSSNQRILDVPKSLAAGSRSSGPNCTIRNATSPRST